MNSGQGLGIEIIGTLQLVLCVLATTDRRRRDLGGSAPLAIGLSVALGHLLAVSGGSPQVGVGVERAGPDRGCQGVLYWAGEGTTHRAHSMGRESVLWSWGTGPAQERGAQGPPDHLSGSVCPSLSGSDCHLSVFFSVCVSLSSSPSVSPPSARLPLSLRRSTTLAAVLTLPGPSARR